MQKLHQAILAALTLKSANSFRKVSAVLIVLAALLSGAPASAGPPDIIAPVAALYRNFAWEALSSDSEVFGGLLASQSASSLARFFDARLVQMIREDNACQLRTRAICKLDFDILFDSQDPRVIDLSIAAVSSHVVEVTFKDPVTDEKTRISYTLARKPNGWRITDVVYTKNSRRSLSTLLAARSKRGIAVIADRDAN
jgi:hypothetical protein